MVITHTETVAPLVIVPRLSRKQGTLNLIRLSVYLSVCLSVCLSVSPSVRLFLCHKTFNLDHIFWGINDRTLIFGTHAPYDKSFLLEPWGDLDLGLWPTSRSNLLPGRGLQFFEFACCKPESKVRLVLRVWGQNAALFDLFHGFAWALYTCTSFTGLQNVSGVTLQSEISEETESGESLADINTECYLYSVWMILVDHSIYIHFTDSHGFSSAGTLESEISEETKSSKSFY